MGNQVTCNKREQIRGLGPRIVPCTMGQWIAVGQQHRQVAVYPHGEHCHHIGSVRIIGDFAEPFGLALGAVHAVRHIEPFKGGVAGRGNLDARFPYEWRIGRRVGQAICDQIRRNGHTVDLGPDQLQVNTVQKKLRVAAIRVGPKCDFTGDAGGIWGQIKR